MDKFELLYFLLALFSTLPFGSSFANYSFAPSGIKLKDGETLLVQINLTFAVDDPILTKNQDLTENSNILAIVTNQDDFHALLLNESSHNLTWIRNEMESTYVASFDFYIRGIFVGYGKFYIKIFDPTTNTTYDKGVVYKVAVVRTKTLELLNLIFTITMTVLICVNTFVMGLQLDWRIILAVLRRPIAPLIGFCCQFIIMPVLAFGFASVLIPNEPVLQFGYFAVGCAPGGGNSNFWTLLLDGNLDLSVTMTFCSNMAAFAMMPFWLFTLGQVFFKNLEGNIQIPYFFIIMSLITLLVPCFLGIIVKHFKPKFADSSKKFIKWSTGIVIIIAIVFGTAANLFVYSLITFKSLLCGMLLPWGGFGLAYGVAWLLRQNHVNCRTIGIETAIQNGGIAIILMTFSLPTPEADLALVMPICVFIFTPIPLTIIWAVKTIYQRRNKSEITAADEEMEEVEQPMKIKLGKENLSEDDEDLKQAEAERMLSENSKSENKL